MPTALSAVSLFNFEVIHANAGPKTDHGFLSWILAFTKKLESLLSTRRQTAVGEVNMLTARCQRRTEGPSTYTRWGLLILGVFSRNIVSKALRDLMGIRCARFLDFEDTTPLLGQHEW